MYNLLDSIKSDTLTFRQLQCGDALLAQFTCPLSENKKAVWAEQNYFVHVIQGRKTWHTWHGSWPLQAGDCVFVKKGAAVVEQFRDEDFCVILFFVPDSFIHEVCQEYGLQPREAAEEQVVTAPVLEVKTDELLGSFFEGMIPFFARMSQPDLRLLEHKFKELILHIISNPQNREIRTYFSHLQTLKKPSIREIMEENFAYRLSQEEFARLCYRSLSAFKRDFKAEFGASPERWLTARRLDHAALLLRTTTESVTDVCLEAGFENTAHFSRVFRERFDCSPVQYRARETDVAAR